MRSGGQVGKKVPSGTIFGVLGGCFGPEWEKFCLNGGVAGASGMPECVFFEEMQSYHVI